MIHERKLDIGVERSSVAPGNLSDWYAQSKSFAAFVAFRNEDFDLQGNGSPELYTGVYRHRGLLRCAGRMIIILNGPLGIGKSLSPKRGPRASNSAWCWTATISS